MILLKECMGISNTEGHHLPAEDTVLRRDKDEQFFDCLSLFYLPEATALIHLGVECALADSLQGVLHVRNTP